MVKSLNARRENINELSARTRRLSHYFESNYSRRKLKRIPAKSGTKERDCKRFAGAIPKARFCLHSTSIPRLKRVTREIRGLPKEYICVYSARAKEKVARARGELFYQLLHRVARGTREFYYAKVRKLSERWRESRTGRQGGRVGEGRGGAGRRGTF